MTKEVTRMNERFKEKKNKERNYSKEQIINDQTKEQMNE